MEEFKLKPFRKCVVRKEDKDLYGVTVGNYMYTGFEPCENVELADEMAKALNDEHDWDAIATVCIALISEKLKTLNK